MENTTDDDGRYWDVHARLEDPMGVLAIALGQWADGRPPPFARQAANTAMDEIDAMLATLHQMRSRLVGEIRASDDATAVRTDKLLAGLRRERGGTP